MKHIVFYSGGIGSWMAAKRVIEKYGKDNVILLFTDTLIEDADLYRFIDETAEQFGAELVKLAEGRTPWQVFKDTRFLGNARLAKCSHVLKQEPAMKWVKENFKPEECVLYLGIDWTEAHRTEAPTRNYAPYKVEFPLCDPPYLTKDEMLDELAKDGIEQPRLYTLGFSHNNCGGGCVRAGQGHFAHLLKTLPEVYAEWERNEQEIRDYLGKDVTILRRTRKGVRYNLSLKELREEIEAEQTDAIDFTEIGGCGCFVTFDDTGEEGTE